METAIFCDFDGTITKNETFVGMLEIFTPKLVAELLPEIHVGRITLKDGVRRFLTSIPASQYPAILDYAKTQPMRSGFVEFLDFLDSREIPLIVVSGGLTGMVKTVLGELTDRVAGIHAINLDCQQEYLQVRSDWEGETELIAKVKVVEHYRVKNLIAIGDSITDLNMAMHIPIVFARDKLADYLTERNKSYIPWSDFYDLRDRLEQIWNY
jgi:2-hydroxy-3-keto-5-methylthiopentenyl-1-phosphate phosphatase